MISTAKYSEADSQAVPNVTYGWIGVGRMGYPMALHLRALLPTTSKLVVCDVNAERVARFVEESKSLSKTGAVEVASSPKEVAEQCVSLRQPYLLSQERQPWRMNLETSAVLHCPL